MSITQSHNLNIWNQNGRQVFLFIRIEILKLNVSYINNMYNRFKTYWNLLFVKEGSRHRVLKSLSIKLYTKYLRLWCLQNKLLQSMLPSLLIYISSVLCNKKFSITPYLTMCGDQENHYIRYNIPTLLQLIMASLGSN